MPRCAAIDYIATIPTVPHLMRHFLTVIVAISVVLLASCGSSSRGPYVDSGEVKRDIEAAKALYEDAREELADSDFEAAEQLLRQALDADLYHGGAHNDLGVILLQRGALYDAAHEFEWARKLLPGHPDPRVNLAIVFERGYKLEQAVEQARAALEARPNYLPAHQTIALIQLRHGLADDHTPDHLSAIIDQTTDERWRDWAITQKMKLTDRSIDL